MLNAPDAPPVDRKVQSGWGKGSNVQYACVRVDGVPMESIAPALVVITTNSQRNHAF
jgi:hypothetical protein